MEESRLRAFEAATLTMEIIAVIILLICEL